MPVVGAGAGAGVVAAGGGGGGADAVAGVGVGADVDFVAAVGVIGLPPPTGFASSPSLSGPLSWSTVPLGFAVLSFALGSRNLSGTPRAAIPAGPT